MLNLFYYKRFQLERSNIILKLSSRLSTYDHVIKIPKTKVESAVRIGSCSHCPNIVKIFLYCQLSKYCRLLFKVLFLYQSYFKASE